MTPRKSSKAFTSFRVIGKRAQELLQRAVQQGQKEDEVSQAQLPPMENQPELLVGFSLASIAKATLIILGILIGTWGLYQITDKIILLLLGFFVAAIIDPGVRMMEKRGVPRGIGILIQFFVALFIFIFLIVSLIPIIADQIQQIAVNMNTFLNDFLANPQISLPLMSNEVDQRLTELVQTALSDLSLTQFTDSLEKFGQNLSYLTQGLSFFISVAGSVGGFFVNLIVVLALAFFIELEKEQILGWIRSFFSPGYKNYMDSKAEAVHHKIGQWARGQLLLAVSIGVLVFIALSILRVPYAATLAVLAGMTEFIPYIGPLIAAIPAVLIAGTEGGFFSALIVAGVYYVVQWCENNLLVPLIMKRAVGISPVAVMFSMLVGVSFPQIIHPILGLLLAVPVATIILLFVEDLRLIRQKRR